MEQCLRIAFWMFVLVGHLHAVPIDEKSLLLSRLRKISCPDGVNFTSPSPKQVPDNCYPAALGMFIAGLEHARQQNCTDTKGRLGQAMVEMDNALTTTPEICNLNTTVHQKFETFVDDLKTFVQRFNGQQTKRR